MTRLTIAAIVAAAAAVAVSAPLVAQQRFQSRTELVFVPVAVSQNRRPTSGLSAADFTLTDNGVRQDIEAVSVEALPIDVTLLLDASNSVRGAMLARLKTAVTDTAALLTPQDRLRLISVQHIIREVFPWQPGGVRPPLDGLVAGGATSLFDGLSAALIRSASPDRRHLIVVFTDGLDTTSVVTPAATQQVAGATDAVVHAVVIIEDLAALKSTSRTGPVLSTVRGGSGLSTGLSEADTQELPSVRPVRDAVVIPTGGQVFPIDADASLGDAFIAAIRAFRTSYVLRYSPSGVDKPGWHNISVSINRPGRYDIRARKGYGG